MRSNEESVNHNEDPAQPKTNKSFLKITKSITFMCINNKHVKTKIKNIMWRGDQNRSTVTKGEHFYHLLGCQPGPRTTASQLEGCGASTWCRVTPALSPLTASMLCYAMLC